MIVERWIAEDRIAARSARCGSHTRMREVEGKDGPVGNPTYPAPFDADGGDFEAGCPVTVEAGCDLDPRAGSHVVLLGRGVAFHTYTCTARVSAFPLD